MANLGNYVPVSVDDITNILTDWDTVKVYRRTSRSGADSLITSIALVTGTGAYSYQDAAGLQTSWYTFTYYNSVTLVESTHSAPVPAAGALVVSQQTLRRMVANEIGCLLLPEGDYSFPCPSGTTDGAGNVGGTTLVCSTYADSLYRTDDFGGYYFLINDGARAGDVRRATALAPASGTFTFSRAFGGQILSGVTFDAYAQKPPGFWNRMLFGDGAGAHLSVWTPFRWPLVGRSAATGGNVTEFRLPYFIEQDDWVLRASVQDGTTLRGHELMPDAGYELISEEGGGLTLYVPGGLPTNQVLLLEGMRHLAPLTSETDVVVLAEEQLQLLVLSAALHAMKGIMVEPGIGQTDGTLWKARIKDIEAQRGPLVERNGAWRDMAPARNTPLVAIGSGGSPRLSSAYLPRYP